MQHSLEHFDFYFAQFGSGFADGLPKIDLRGMQFHLLIRSKSNLRAFTLFAQPNLEAL